MQYNKQPFTTAQVIHHLGKKGLAISSQTAAQHAIETIGYFRLRFYMRGFQTHTNKQFLPGTQFQDILNIYEFDRALRLLTLNGIERLEVGLRAALSNIPSLSSKDPHWYLKHTNFQNKTAHDETMSRIRSTTGIPRHGNSPGLKHYHNTYSQPSLPPIWLVCELLSFGPLSHMLNNLNPQLRKAHAKMWSASHPYLPEKLLISWFRSIATLRNDCAHHSRLWQSKLTVNQPAPYKNKSWSGAQCASLDFKDTHSFYARACAMKLLLDSMEYGAWWRDSLLELLTRHPNLNPKNDLGFLANWQSRPLWA